MILAVLNSCFGSSTNIESINIDGESRTLDINDNVVYEATLDPEDASDAKIKVVIDDEDIISGKYKNGKITINSNDIEGETSFHIESDDVKSNAISISVVDKTKKEQEEAARKAEEERLAQEAAQKAEQERIAQQAAASTQPTEEMVYISSTGSKYHSNQYCSNMNSPRQIAISEAKNRGYTACKKCY